MKKVLVVYVGVFLLMLNVVPVKADIFWVAGKIERTLSATRFGECAILLAAPAVIGHKCPNSRILSFDCKAVYIKESIAARNYASAVVAASLGKSVSLRVNDEQKHDFYCVADRLDIRY